MRKLHFCYRMQLDFEGEVSSHYFRFRCLPCRDEVQQDLGTVCRIEPSGFVREIKDGFGNRCLAGEALAPHSRLSVISEGRVQVDLSARREAEAGDIYRFPSPYTQPEENIRRLYSIWKEKYSQAGGNSAVPGIPMIKSMMAAVSDSMRYVPGITDIRTTASAALAGGEGVCQDYAHIFLALCRLAGVPARYVAGAMAGEGATHAWTEVWLSGMWVGADPTNSCLTDEGYIRFSQGRDYGDCTVDRGCFVGPGGQSQTIFVKVEDAAW